MVGKRGAWHAYGITIVGTFRKSVPLQRCWLLVRCVSMSRVGMVIATTSAMAKHGLWCTKTIVSPKGKLNEGICHQQYKYGNSKR